MAAEASDHNIGVFASRENSTKILRGSPVDGRLAISIKMSNLFPNSGLRNIYSLIKVRTPHDRGSLEVYQLEAQLI